MKRVALCAAAVLAMSCQSSPTPSSQSAASPTAGAADLEKLTADFTYGALAMSPSAATQAGYLGPWLWKAAVEKAGSFDVDKIAMPRPLRTRGISV